MHVKMVLSAFSAVNSVLCDNRSPTSLSCIKTKSFKEPKLKTIDELQQQVTASFELAWPQLSHKDHEVQQVSRSLPFCDGLLPS